MDIRHAAPADRVFDEPFDSEDIDRRILVDAVRGDIEDAPHAGIARAGALRSSSFCALRPTARTGTPAAASLRTITPPS
jgi:hypothetical protein